MWSISGRGQRLFKNTLYTSGVKSSWGIESFCEMEKKIVKEWNDIFICFFVNRSLATALFWYHPCNLEENKFCLTGNSCEKQSSLRSIFKKKKKVNYPSSFHNAKFFLGAPMKRKERASRSVTVLPTDNKIPMKPVSWPIYLGEENGSTLYLFSQSFHRTREQIGPLSHNWQACSLIAAKMFPFPSWRYTIKILLKCPRTL